MSVVGFEVDSFWVLMMRSLMLMSGEMIWRSVSSWAVRSCLRVWVWGVWDWGWSILWAERKSMLRVRGVLMWE